MNLTNYPNLRSFMKRHGLTIKNIADVTGKTYPPTHQKITKKRTQRGKAALFDIEEAYAIIRFIKSTEQKYLEEKYSDYWKEEWEKRWGNIRDWFEYIFFDEVVTNATDYNRKGA